MQKPERGPLLPWEIIIDGAITHDRQNTNYRIRIDGNQIELPFRLFRIFTILALRRDIDSGWVDRGLITWSSTLANRYVSRTRTTLRAAEWRKPGGVDGAWLVIETNPTVPYQYRLIARPETIRVNPELARIDDRIIASEVKAFSERAVDRLICPDNNPPALPAEHRPDIEGFTKAFATFDESDGLGPVVLFEVTPKEEDDDAKRNRN